MRDAGAAGVRIDPERPAVDVVSAALLALADDLRSRAHATAADGDPEHLHDLRLAVRKSRALLAQSRAVVSAPEVAAARRDLTWLSAVTGPVRDIDVMLDDWAARVEPLGDDARALGPALAALVEQRAVVRSQLVDALGSERATRFFVEWPAALHHPERLAGHRGQRPIGRVVARRVTAMHIALLEDGRAVGASSPAAQLHDLRKDGKVLRYVVEAMGGLFSERERRRYLKRLRRLQTVLGQHQDADVQCVALAALVAELHGAGGDAECSVAIGRLVERSTQALATARGSYDERFAAFDSPRTAGIFDAVIGSIHH